MGRPISSRRTHLTGLGGLALALGDGRRCRPPRHPNVPSGRVGRLTGGRAILLWPWGPREGQAPPCRRATRTPSTNSPPRHHPGPPRPPGLAVRHRRAGSPSTAAVIWPGRHRRAGSRRPGGAAGLARARPRQRPRDPDSDDARHAAAGRRASDADRHRYAADWSRAEELAGARAADLAAASAVLAPLARDARGVRRVRLPVGQPVTGPAPRASAASTKGARRNSRTRPRTRRATGIQPVSPSRVQLQRPRGVEAAMPSVARAPTSRRASASRPCLSVPRGGRPEPSVPDELDAHPVPRPGGHLGVEGGGLLGAGAVGDQVLHGERPVAAPGPGRGPGWPPASRGRRGGAGWGPGAARPRSGSAPCAAGRRTGAARPWRGCSPPPPPAPPGRRSASGPERRAGVRVASKPTSAPRPPVRASTAALHALGVEAGGVHHGVGPAAPGPLQARGDQVDPHHRAGPRRRGPAAPGAAPPRPGPPRRSSPPAGRPPCGSRAGPPRPARRRRRASSLTPWRDGEGEVRAALGGFARPRRAGGRRGVDVQQDVAGVAAPGEDPVARGQPAHPLAHRLHHADAGVAGAHRPAPRSWAEPRPRRLEISVPALTRVRVRRRRTCWGPGSGSTKSSRATSRGPVKTIPRAVVGMTRSLTLSSSVGGAGSNRWGSLPRMALAAQGRPAQTPLPERCMSVEGDAGAAGDAGDAGDAGGRRGRRGRRLSVYVLARDSRCPAAVSGCWGRAGGRRKTRARAGAYAAAGGAGPACGAWPGPGPGEADPRDGSSPGAEGCRARGDERMSRQEQDLYGAMVVPAPGTPGDGLLAARSLCAAPVPRRQLPAAWGPPVEQSPARRSPLR